MAGHSHAKNVMHRKAAQGAKKAQAFGKLIREITVSAKIGLPDPAANPRLRAAVKAALTANMTRDTIDRAIKRASTAGQRAVLSSWKQSDQVIQNFTGSNPRTKKIIPKSRIDRN